MQKISATRVKKNSSILQNALREDILVTKRDKPYVVVLDYKRYLELIKNSNQNKSSKWIDETFDSMSEDDASTLLEDIYTSRVNKDEIYL